MLSFHAWPLEIKLEPSQTAKSVFYIFCFFATCIYFYSLWVSFYFLLLMPIWLLLSKDNFHRFVSLQHLEAVQGLTCQQGLWTVYRGRADALQKENGFVLDELFVSKIIIIVSLKKQDGFFMERIIIFRDQLSPEIFQYLFVVLKFQRGDLFLDN